MAEAAIQNERLADWGNAIGMYRGSWLYSLNYSPEANAIAKAICVRRDLWKQNETGEIIQMVQRLLDDLDAAR